MGTLCAGAAIGADEADGGESFRAGSEHLRTRDYEAARSAFESAVQQNPEHVEAWFKLGLTRAGMRDWPAALEAYQRTVELDPAHVKAYNNIANVHYRQGRYEPAAVWYAKALELDPDYLLALFHYGWVLRHLNRPDEAETAFSHCLDVPAQSNREKSTQIDCLYYLGALKSRAGDHRGTVAAMERVLSLKPGHVEARYYLGMAYRKLGRIEDARRELEIHRQMLRAARGSKTMQRQPE